MFIGRFDLLPVRALGRADASAGAATPTVPPVAAVPRVGRPVSVMLPRGSPEATRAPHRVYRADARVAAVMAIIDRIRSFLASPQGRRTSDAGRRMVSDRRNQERARGWLARLRRR